jgi:hypothetical protein
VDRLGKAPSAFFQKSFDGVIGSYMLAYRRSPSAHRRTSAYGFALQRNRFTAVAGDHPNVLFL